MSPGRIVLGARRLLRRAAAERELNDEVAHYLEMAAAEYERRGLPRDEAMRLARLDFAGVENAKEAVRDADWDGWLASFLRDFGLGARGLRRNPGFAIVAILTLALGIGANTAMFSVVNAVLLRPLPYREPSRLALLWTDDVRRDLHEEATAYRVIQDWRARNTTFQDLAYFSARRVDLVDGSDRERSRGAHVSGNLFALLGARPLRGRVIVPSDEENAANVVVISHALWLRRFHGDSSVIGRTLAADVAGKGDALTMQIVGVMPASFYFPDKTTELWIPSTLYWRFTRERDERFPEWARNWTAVGRLKPGVALSAARADLDRVARQLAAVYPSTVPDFPGFRANVVPVLDHIAGRSLQSALWILLAAVAVVLLVACANVANLLLARGATRRREFAIRGALGAGRGRLIRQLVAESMVLALSGGALGVLVAFAAARALGAIGAARVPRVDEVTIDARVLVFALAASLVAGLAFGIAPAIRISAADASEALKEGAQSAGPRLRRARGLLVVAECALAVVLLAGAGLLLRSLERLHAVDPGFTATGVLSVRIEFPREPPLTDAERHAGGANGPLRASSELVTMRGMMARVAAMPGVQSVGLIDDMFMSGRGHASISIPGRSADSIEAGELNEGSVTPEFFATMHVPLLRGRLLTTDDAATKIRALFTHVDNTAALDEKERRATPEPVVVNEAFVRRYFPSDDPVGKRFCTDPTNKTYWYTIVGVVGDMRRQGLDRRAIPEYYGPYIPSGSKRADLLIRAAGDPLRNAADIRRAIVAEIPGVTIPTISTADRELGSFNAERDFQTWLLALFALLAVSLAAVGIFGVVHYSVAERTRELGVRIALGASPADVMGLVIREGMTMPLIGMLLGVAGAFAATRAIEHMLFGIDATDPVTFAGVVVMLAFVSLLACVVPARRAARADPMVALR